MCEQVAIIEHNALSKIAWQYLVIDEAHRIKNEDSKLSGVRCVLTRVNRCCSAGRTAAASAGCVRDDDTYSLAVMGDGGVVSNWGMVAYGGARW